jgi:hypothetical protein
MADHYVYIITHFKNDMPCEPIKVGITGNLNARLAQLRTASAYKLILLHYFPMPNREIAEHIETAFHETQKEKRLNGEWFDINFVQALQLMCINIRVALDTNTDLQGEDLELALDMSGVLSAEDKLRTIGVSVCRGPDGAHQVN